MGEVHVFQCDGPTCTEVAEDAWDHDDLRFLGWQVFPFLAFDTGEDDDEAPEERVSFFCSFACMRDWAAELVE